MSEIITVAGYGLAILLGLFWLTTRRKYLDSLALYKDAATKYELHRDRLTKSEKQLKSAEKLQSGHAAQLKALEQDLHRARQSSDEATKKWEALQTEKQSTLPKLERQIDHLTEQNQSLTGQLAEAVREKKQALTELATLEKKGSEQAHVQVKALQEKLQEAQRELGKLGKQTQSLKKSNEHLRSVLKKVDPDQIRRFKAKSQSLEQLYKSMKNLREMAEERNQNWEKAIRVMAAHITQADTAAIDQQQPIGPLLGEALERIGSSLVIDEHSPSASSDAASSDEKQSDSNNDVTDAIHSSADDADAQRQPRPSQELSSEQPGEA